MPELSIVTFNSHGGVDPRTHAPYPLADTIAGWPADIVIIQECWRPDVGDAAIDVAHEQRGGELHEVQFGRGVQLPKPEIEPHGNGRFSIAVLSRFHAVGVTEITLSRVRADPMPVRRALHLRLDVDGTPVDLIAVHTTSRLPHGPYRQLQSLARQVPAPGVPTIVAGDCNFWAAGVDRIFTGWTRAVRGATWPAHRPHSQIDHILVRPADIDVVSGAVLDNVGSDHRPITATLHIR
jgi:endonuclease/exonuclease/phosphatase family metal-dependent hydrolase